MRTNLLFLQLFICEGKGFGSFCLRSEQKSIAVYFRPKVFNTRIFSKILLKYLSQHTGIQNTCLTSSFSSFFPILDDLERSTSGFKVISNGNAILSIDFDLLNKKFSIINFNDLFSIAHIYPQTFGIILQKEKIRAPFKRNSLLWLYYLTSSLIKLYIIIENFCSNLFGESISSFYSLAGFGRRHYLSVFFKKGPISVLNKATYEFIRNMEGRHLSSDDIIAPYGEQIYVLDFSHFYPSIAHKLKFSWGSGIFLDDPSHLERVAKESPCFIRCECVVLKGPPYILFRGRTGVFECVL